MMTSSKQLLSLHASICLCLGLLVPVDGCLFPDFLQSNGAGGVSDRKWMSHVINDDDDSTSSSANRCASIVDFVGGRWRQLSPDRRRCSSHSANVTVGSFRRECVTSVQRNRYVVRHFDVIASRTAREDDTYSVRKNDDDMENDDVETDGDRQNVDNSDVDGEDWDSFNVGGGTQSFRGYACVEFVRRGPTVVQVRSSSTFRWLPGSSACDDDNELLLDDWPLVDYGAALFEAPACRLPVVGGGGGFSVRMFDKVVRRGVCDALHGETRVEVGCGSSNIDDDEDEIDRAGRLIEFRFRHAGCVPGGFGMAVEQRVYCVASWTDPDIVDDGGGVGIGHHQPPTHRQRHQALGGYSFAVLRHDVDRRVWCFRYPKSSGSSAGAGTGDGARRHGEHGSGGPSSFSGLLFRDVLCERRGPTPHKTERYLRVDFVADSPIFDGRLEPTTRSKTAPATAASNDDDRGYVEDSTAADDDVVDDDDDEDDEDADKGLPIVNGRLLCRDDYELCQFWTSMNQPCGQTNGPEVLACPRRCGVCSDSRPAACALPDDLIGRWNATGGSSAEKRRPNAAARVGYSSIVIGRHSLQFRGSNTSYTLSCVQWINNFNNSTPRSSPSSKSPLSSTTVHEWMFVRLFPNGCRPRYVCARFRRPSPDVLLVRTSRSVTWPFVGETGNGPVDCSTHFRYGGDDENEYRLFISGSSAAAAAVLTSSYYDVADRRRRCGAATVGQQLATTVGSDDFEVEFDVGMLCRGRFQTSGDDEDDDAGDDVFGRPTTGYRRQQIIDENGLPTSDKPEVEVKGGTDSTTTTFKLILFDCPALGGHESEQSYRCVDSIGFGRSDFTDSGDRGGRPGGGGGGGGDRRLLTKSGDDGDVLCWWFPAGVADRIFLLPGAACYDDEVGRRLSSSAAAATSAYSTRNSSSNHGATGSSRRENVLATFVRIAAQPAVVAELQELRRAIDDDDDVSVRRDDVDGGVTGNENTTGVYGGGGGGGSGTAINVASPTGMMVVIVGGVLMTTAAAWLV